MWLFKFWLWICQWWQSWLLILLGMVRLKTNNLWCNSRCTLDVLISMPSVWRSYSLGELRCCKYLLKMQNKGIKLKRTMLQVSIDWLLVLASKFYSSYMRQVHLRVQQLREEDLNLILRLSLRIKINNFNIKINSWTYVTRATRFLKLPDE